MKELKTIKVDDDVHKRLVKRGKWGETMNKIIEGLLSEVEDKKK